MQRLHAAALVAVALFAGAIAEADIHDAVRRGDADELRTLLAAASAVDLEAPARDGLTPLLRAAQSNDVELVRVLLDGGADPNAANRFGVTALWLAATNRNPTIVELLLEHGADATAAMPHGETALMAAGRSGDAGSIRLLIDAGADPNVSEETQGETALIWAAAENHVAAVRALIEGGADPDLASRVLELAPMNWMQVGMVSTVLPVGGWTPMMYAARENAQGTAPELVALGADPDAQDPEGNTALLIALANDHFDLAALLLEAGADPNVADKSGGNALFSAVDRVTAGPDFGRPPVPRFDKLGALDIVRLAIEHGADVNAGLVGPTIARHHGFPDRSLGVGGTALMRAARGNDIALIRLLLDAGARIDATNEEGATVIHAMAGSRAPGDDAGQAAQRELLEFLTAAGADIAAVTSNGQTAVHRAARSGNAPFIRLLHERGVALDTADEDGNTPHDLVSAPGRGNNPAIAELLESLIAGN